MIITSLTRQKRNRRLFSVSLDGEYAFSLTDETVMKYGLKEGLQVDGERLAAAAADDERRRALDACLALLGVRNRSVKELKDRLTRKGYSPAASDYALGRMKELGYLDDTRFAKGRAEDLRARQQGPDRIRAELRQAGVASPVIDSVIKEVYPADEGGEYETALAAGEKKLRNSPAGDRRAEARRLTAYLARRGFRLSTVSRVVRALTGKRGGEDDFSDEPPLLDDEE